MDKLLHIPFLQALGYAIINSLWQFALLWLLYFAVNTLFKLSSHQKYSTGLILEFAGFTWFLQTVHFYYIHFLLEAQHAVTGHQEYFAGLANSGTFKQHFFSLVSYFERFFPFLSIAYLALLFILAVRWLYAYQYTQHVRTAGLTEIEASWKLFVQKLSSQLSIKSPVHIFLSELVQTPLTIGFLKPVILIPLATINYLNTQQMEAVILHELAHIKRFDYLFNLVLALIGACLFFNPFMQLIQQQVKKERENCCDDWVLKYEYSAATYARALLQIASHQTHSPLLALKAADNKHLLISRIKRIIEKKERTFFNYKHQLLGLLVMTLVFSLLSFLPSQKKVTVASKQLNITLEPTMAKAGNSLFNPVLFRAGTSKISSEQKKKKLEIKSVKSDDESHFPAVAEPVSEDVHDEIDGELPDETAQYSAADAPAVRAIATVHGFDALIKNLPEYPEEKQSKVETKNRLLEEADKQNEIGDNHFKRIRREPARNNTVIFDLSKVRLQFKNALDQIKSSKKEAELMNLQGLLIEGIRKIKETRPSTPPFNLHALKIKELALLEKQIQIQIDSINQPALYTIRLNTDVNYNFQLPAVVYTFSGGEKSPSFSYEYSGKPRINIINAPALKEIPKVKKRIEKVLILVDENDEDKIQREIPPPPPPAPASTKPRGVYMIKI